jgi:hypothetical protein
LEKGLKKVFAQDQLAALSRGTMRGTPWSQSTVKKGVKLRFACGTSGYNFLLDLGLPFPSVRSLQRKLEHVAFLPGIQHQTLELLSLKVKNTSHVKTFCCITLDEMSITAGYDYNRADGSLLGGVTIKTCIIFQLLYDLMVPQGHI